MTHIAFKFQKDEIHLKVGRQGWKLLPGQDSSSRYSNINRPTKFPVDPNDLDTQKDTLLDLSRSVPNPVSPLQPPWRFDQLAAMEVKFGFKFPAILRFYLLNISREVQVEHCQRTTIQPSCIEYHNNRYWPDRHMFQDNESICLDGPLAGLVPYSSHYGDPELYTRAHLEFCTVFSWLKNGLKMWAARQAAEAREVESYKEAYARDVAEGSPEGLLQYVRSNTRESKQGARIDRYADSCRSALRPHVRKIKKAWKLFRWRRDHVWNPHTKYGRLNLLIKARAAGCK